MCIIREKDTAMSNNKPLIKGIHHVSMKCCNDAELVKTIAFYKDILGLPVAREWLFAMDQLEKRLNSSRRGSETWQV